MSRALLTDLTTGRVYLLDGVASIGRDSDNEVILNDQTVSGHHAIITNTGSAWYIADNGSRNGVEMNNFRVPSEGKLGLRDGCQLKLGNTLLRFTTSPETIENYIASQNRNNGSESKNDSQSAIQGSSNRTKTISNTHGKRAKRKKLLIPVVSASVIAIIVLTWCLVNHSNGGKRLAEGNYEAAIAAYNRDFLFSGSQRIEAALLAGEHAFSQHEYSEAAYYFRSAGDAGKERWSDSLYEQAKHLISDKKFDEAIKVLSEISSEIRAQEQIGLATLEIAQQQFDEGNYVEAIQTASGIQNTKYADVTAFLDKTYHTIGNDYFADGRYQDAREAYEKCERDPEAHVNAEILKGLVEHDYYSAAIRADSSLNNKETDLSREQWLTAFESFIGHPNMTDIDMALKSEAARVIVSGKVAFESASVIDAFRDYAPHEAMIGSYETSTEGLYVVDDLSALYAKCAQNPNGKVLIIAQRHSYSDGNQTQAILFDLMRLLPSECYPASLDEVEYVVVINYDYEKEGSYMYVTVALKEYADITVYQASDMRQLYKSKIIYGASAPSSFSYYGTPPAWKSGKAPNMGEEIHTAISSIID